MIKGVFSDREGAATSNDDRYPKTKYIIDSRWFVKKAENDWNTSVDCRIRFNVSLSFSMIQSIACVKLMSYNTCTCLTPSGRSCHPFQRIAVHIHLNLPQQHERIACMRCESYNVISLTSQHTNRPSLLRCVTALMARASIHSHVDLLLPPDRSSTSSTINPA